MAEKIIITENFISEEYEAKILKIVPRKAQKGNFRMRNQVLRWGSRIPYDNNIVSEKIPLIFMEIANKIPFDSVTINEYFAGQRIEYHIDKPNGGDVVYVISLLSDAHISFRRGDIEESYLMPRLSLTAFSEDLRWLYEHSVVAVEKRYSVVFRNSKIL